jgi:uridine phosphorylase
MIQSSELILNPDGSVPPEFKTGTYCTQHHFRSKSCGKITQFFDSIEFSTQKRIQNPNGLFKGKRISVISTGIGPDNIDIVINELDALVISI